MITKCTITPEATVALAKQLGEFSPSASPAVELEFKEVPYFIVSRSRDRWSEEQGDINAVSILDVNERGIVADPDSHPRKDGEPTSVRRALIPWANIISVTLG